MSLGSSALQRRLPLSFPLCCLRIPLLCSANSDTTHASGLQLPKFYCHPSSSFCLSIYLSFFKVRYHFLGDFLRDRSGLGWANRKPPQARLCGSHMHAPVWVPEPKQAQLRRHLCLPPEPCFIIHTLLPRKLSRERRFFSIPKLMEKHDLLQNHYFRRC